MAVKRKQSHETYHGPSGEMAAFADCLEQDKYFQDDTGLTYVRTAAGWILDGIAVGANIAASTIAHTIATIGVASGAALAANASRKYALLVNDSDSVIYLKIGAAAVLNAGIRLNASGGSYEMSAAYGNLDTRVINAISSAANKILIVTEGI